MPKRCQNDALAGPFGGCFTVQQTNGTGRTNSTPGAVDTAKTLEAISHQIEVNKQDLDIAISAIKLLALQPGTRVAQLYPVRCILATMKPTRL